MMTRTAAVEGVAAFLWCVLWAERIHHERSFGPRSKLVLYFWGLVDGGCKYWKQHHRLVLCGKRISMEKTTSIDGS